MILRSATRSLTSPLYWSSWSLKTGFGFQVDELSQAFREGYESVAGPLNEELLIAYTAHKRLSKALRVARALRPDGDERAEQILNRAARSFSEMSAAYRRRGLERAS